MEEQSQAQIPRRMLHLLIFTHSSKSLNLDQKGLPFLEEEGFASFTWVGWRPGSLTGVAHAKQHTVTQNFICSGLYSLSTHACLSVRARQVCSQEARRGHQMLWIMDQRWLWAAVGCCELLWAAVGCCGKLWEAVSCWKPHLSPL